MIKMSGQRLINNAKLLLKILKKRKKAREERAMILQKLSYMHQLPSLQRKIKNAYFEPKISTNNKIDHTIAIIGSKEDDRLYIPALKQVLHDRFAVIPDTVYNNKESNIILKNYKVWVVINALGEGREEHIENQIANGNTLLIINNGKNNIPKFLVDEISNPLVEHGNYADVSLNGSNKKLLLSLYGCKCVNIPRKEGVFGIWKDINIPALTHEKFGEGDVFIINYDLILEYLTANLFHQFNLYKGSKTEIVCNALRILEYIFEMAGITNFKKSAKLLITVDTEAQLQYYDNELQLSTNIFSLKNKDGMLMSNLVKRIQERIELPILFFLAVGQLDEKCKDTQGLPLNNAMQNIEVMKQLRGDCAIGFHGYTHDEHRKRWIYDELTEEFFSSELERGLKRLEELSLKIIPINRYPGLTREPFCLPMLERFGFKLDSSDFIEDLDACIAPCMYRLYKLERDRICPSSIFEIPTFFADPLVMGSNKVINDFMDKVGGWKDWHESHLALIFHDKVLGFPKRNVIIVNLGDLRRNKTGKEESMKYFVKKLQKSRIIGHPQRVCNEAKKDDVHQC